MSSPYNQKLSKKKTFTIFIQHCNESQLLQLDKLRDMLGILFVEEGIKLASFP